MNIYIYIYILYIYRYLYTHAHMTLSLESLFAKLRNFNGPWAAWKKTVGEEE